MKKRLIFISIILLIVISFTGQTMAGTSPWAQYSQYIPRRMPEIKRHLRGVWISTVLNLDWPSVETRDLKNESERIQKCKEELVDILDRAVSMNMNAVFFQVSPEGDALYSSDIVPWSRYLTGKYVLDPGFDPLAFVIEEAHRRNLELHAWFNPYRVSMSADSDTKKSLAVSKSVYSEHPEWVKSAAGRFVVDPGIPEARKWVFERVMEVVRRYDIDGVHFDDYFYYEGTQSRLNDNATYLKYNQNQFTNIGDFRRNNTYMLIKEVSEAIRQEKPWVKFGISPSGVWADKSEEHPDGSNTSAGYTNYDTSFADTKKWVEEELIDYIAPQIYYSFGNSRAPYGEIALWWSEVVKGKNVHLYIGQALYKINDDTDKFFKGQNAITEFSNQLKFNGYHSEISGSIFFRAKNLTDERKQQAIAAVKNELWASKALVPVMEWKGGNPPEKPSYGFITKTDKGIKLTWTGSDPDTAYYAVYRFGKDKQVNTLSSELTVNNLITTVRKVSDITEFIDTGVTEADKYQYVVTALDRLHHESEGIIINKGYSAYFYDVDLNYQWAQTAIDELYRRNIVTGDGKGSFYPSHNTKRGDFVQMLVRALNLNADADDNYEDVPLDSYYYNSIGIAKKMGIALSYGGRFEPEKNITREDMMVITLRALAIAGYEFKLVGEDVLKQYSDADEISEYARTAVACMTESGYVKGTNGMAAPKSFATRAEITVMLHRILEANGLLK